MNQKGVSLIGAIFLIVILTIMGVVFVSLSTTGLEVSVIEVDSTKAIYAAEAGIEAAMGHLKQTPVSTNWVWNDGYDDTAVGDEGTVDVEVLQYEGLNDRTDISPYDRPIDMDIKDPAGVGKPPSTVYVVLSWDPAENSNNLGLELYNDDPPTTLVASSITSNNPEVIRYTVPDPGGPYPVSLTYTTRVLGNTSADEFDLKIAHPDEPGFGVPDNTRAIIALGQVNDAVREVFKSFSRQP